MICPDCNGEGTIEVHFCTFGNEIHYTEEECGCNNGYIEEDEHSWYWVLLD